MTRRKRLPNPNSPEEVRRAFAKVNEDVDLAIGDLTDFIALVAATYVPYSGATSNVALGAFDLSATDVTVTGIAHINTITSTSTLSITNNVDMGGSYTVTNLTAPVNGSDAVTLDYLVDAITEASDHGALTGLADDDHLQYHTDARAATWLAAGHETTYNHANYDTAFSWGNHDGLYDLAGAAAGVIAAHESTYNHANYDTAYGWGDHAGLYDTIGSASTAVGTHESTYNHANYDTAYGWGNHAGLYDVTGTAASAVGTHEGTYNHTNYNTAYSWGDHAGLYDAVGTAASAVSAHELAYDHDSFASTIESLTNGSVSSIPICTPVYMNAAGTFLKAKADALETSRIVGLLVDGVAGGGTVGVQMSGVLTASTLQWDGATGGSGGLTFDTIYYLSPTTAGLLTTTAPSTVGQTVVPVGLALSTTKMKILDRSIILL